MIYLFECVRAQTVVYAFVVLGLHAEMPIIKRLVLDSAVWTLGKHWCFVSLSVWQVKSSAACWLKDVDVWQANGVFVKSCHPVKVNEYPLIQHYSNLKSITVQGTSGQPSNDSKASEGTIHSRQNIAFQTCQILQSFVWLVQIDYYQQKHHIIALGIVIWW